MDAIVLCGGSGTRVKEITKDAIPKILIPIGGAPFIDHLIDALLIQGVKSIVFAAGIQGDQIVDYLETSLSLPQRRYGYFQAVVEDYPRGTGGAIKCALDHSDILKKSDSHIMVVNGDSITFKPKYTEVMGGLPVPSFRSMNFIWGTKTVNDGSFGSIQASGRDKFVQDIHIVNAFSEKVAGLGFVSNGWYCLYKSLFDDVPEVCSLEYDLLPNWVKDELFFLVETHLGDKVDIGTTDRIKNLRI
jgi:NDP-sugar pyrophosphorylase family protein